LPLTPNGKLDRRSLLRPAQSVSETDGDFTDVQKTLAEIWCDLIGIESVGVHDNFFELGGHSLLATQLIFRVRKAFRVEVPLFELFKEPTIASLANIIETLREALPPVAESRESRRAGTVLSYAQQRLWFLDTLDPGTAAHNESVALRLIGELDVQALQKSINEVVRRHDVLRATFASEDGQAVQTIVADVNLDLPLHDLTHVPPASRENEAKQLIVNAAKQPFYLSHGPLLRTLLVRLSEQEHVFGLVIHHIVCDVASHSVFVREMIELYETVRLGQPPALKELSMQYADFAQSQREWVKTEGVNTQLPYWKERLAALKSVPELIPDKPRPAVRTYNGARHILTMPSNALTDSSFTTILTALNVLLHHYTGSDNIVVGTDCSGRDSAETENLIGPFTNQLVLSTDVAGDPTFNELYDRVRETLAAAQAHQRLPFEEVVEALKPPRDRARTPMFQIKIISCQPVLEEREVASLRITPLEIDTVTARFDLTILLEKSPAVVFEYNTDLFEPSRIASIARSLDAILKRVSSNGDVRLSGLSDFITETQRKEQDARQTQLKTNVSKQLRNLKRRTTLAGTSNV
jgi:acyl carrier protein